MRTPSLQPRTDLRQGDPHEGQRTLEVVRGLSMRSRYAFMRCRPRLEYALLLQLVQELGRHAEKANNAFVMKLIVAAEL